MVKYYQTMPGKKADKKNTSKKNKYKNVSAMTQTIIGVSEIPAGGTVETDIEINNPNFLKQ